MNADVFKWQREYWPVLNNTLSTHMDGITQLTLRVTDGSEGRSIWIDDLRSVDNYLTNPAGSTITSSLGNRYMQYRVINTSVDPAVSSAVTVVNMDYNLNMAPNIPTLDSPSNLSTGQVFTPQLKTTAIDSDLDYVRYKIELCQNPHMTIGCQTFDQTSSQTGWSGQNTETSTAYTSGTQATYTLQTNLTQGTTYYWRSYAIDPAGLNTWSSTQTTPYSFVVNAISRSTQNNEYERFIARRESSYPSTSVGWASITGSAETGTTASTNGWIAGSNFTVGDKYLILVWGSHQTDSSSSRSGIRVKHGSTSFTESEAIEITNQTSSSYKTPYFWFTVWDGLNENIEAEIYWNGGAPGTEARVEDVTLIALNVTDLITANNLKYNISNVGGPLDQTFTSKSVVSFTPATNNDLWWIMGYSKANFTQYNSDDYQARLNINGSIKSTMTTSVIYDSDTPVYGIGTVAQLPNSVQNIDLELRESGDNHDWDSAGVFALRLNSFDSFMADHTAGNGPTMSTPSDWVEQNSLDILLRKTGSFITASGAIVDDAGARVINRLQSSDINITDDIGGWRQQAGDRLAVTLGDINIGYTSGLKNIDMDSQTTLAGSASLSDTWTVGFSLERAGSGPNLDLPVNSATNQKLKPQLRVTSIDPDSDTLKYKIDFCTDLAMTLNCQTFNQVSSQTGWSGQNSHSSTRYTSGTQATYTIQSDLSINSTYYWRAYSIDPDGTNTFTPASPVHSFTTTQTPYAPTLIEIEGVTNPTEVSDITPEISAVHTDPDGDSANFIQIQVNTASDFTGTSKWNTGQLAMTTTANGVRSPLIIYGGSALNLQAQTYYVRVKFWDVNGAESPWSTTAQFTMDTLDPPTGCHLVDSDLTDTSIVIRWNDISTIEGGYRIQKSTNGGTFSTLIDKAADSVTHTDTIVPGFTYSYRIAASLSGLYSTYCTTSTSDANPGNIRFEGIIFQ
ncbi:hypothetical protein HYV12_00235 [Candidatus Dojkabacteria bacterium]|nr:hypothetical protein [Candidatus Dojkabacteria bacterium]